MAPPPRRSRLRQLRLDRDLTQAELARRAGISPRSVQRIEKSADGAGVSLRHLVQLAIVLECKSVLELIDEDWLIFSESGVDVSIPRPTRRTLERSVGGDLPRPGRDRARGARGVATERSG